MRKISVLLVLLCVLLSAAARNMVTENDVRYSDAGVRCVADVLHPADKSARLPVIVWFHGGGLTGGNKFIPPQLPAAIMWW